MEIIEEKNIRSIKEAWERLVPSENGKIYLTYPFHLEAWRCFRLYSIARGNRMKLRYICLKDETVRTILPVIINKKNRKISFAGEWAGAGYNDFIGGTQAEAEKIIDYLKAAYPGYRLVLRDISARSHLNAAYPTEVQKQCYSIPITGGYEGWMASLKSKTRTNIRRVYRRIEKEDFEVQFHIATKMKRKDIKRICILYFAHLNELLGKTESGIDRIKAFVRKYYKITPIFAGINSIERCKVAYTTHFGKIISFHIFYEEENGIIIPKCAYDSAYAKYEVGSYNLLEIIRTYSENPVNIDLSRSLHEYKVWYGGQPYPNYCLELFFT